MKAIETNELLPEEWQPIVEYIRSYPRFFFHSSTLSDRLSKIGISLSSQKLSKMLLEMHESGLLDRFTRGNGIHTRSYYGAKK